MKIRNKRDNSTVDELKIDYDDMSPTLDITLFLAPFTGSETLQLTLDAGDLKTQFTVTLDEETHLGLTLDP